MNLVRDSLHKMQAPLCGLLLAVQAAAPALAADASDWSMDIRSAARLIAADAPASPAQYRVGVELRMDPGWHTYWRYPGDSGVPPRIEFGDSENLRDFTVSYPAPRAFTDETGIFIGYRDHVVFPVRITPRDPQKPVKLKLDLFYAVCEKLCVPASAHTELTLAPGLRSAFDDRIAKAETGVPKQVSAQQAGLTAQRVAGAPKPRVELDVAAPGNNDVQVFAEGPSAEWALPVPKPVSGAPKGHRRFSLELDGLPPSADPKAPVDLTFTIVGGDRALETTTHLD
jgi:DsbC/DsbD-like thiol-disulfide interchange protein